MLHVISFQFRASRGGVKEIVKTPYNSYLQDINLYIRGMDDSSSFGDSLVNSSDNSTREGTVLETFSHQVGGRSLILTYDRNTVCKPLNPQELRFYLDLPESLRPFTPHYKGKKPFGACVQPLTTTCLAISIWS